MKEIGVVICNYNKKEKVLDCIQSVLESKNADFDVFVVDNASDDGSVQMIKDTFGEKVKLIENKENLGGSGGFNTGLRIVRDLGYRYFMCLDDDAAIDENALHHLWEYMELNADVGMAGARVYHAQMPEYVQQCGISLNFKHATAKTLYADVLEDGTLPEVVECDAVATCAVMIRGDVIRTTDVGIMPEDNFIYWDDMEWSYRMKLAGYRIVTLASAAAVHQMGANTKKPTTFLNYYMWRNRTRFFMQYTKREEQNEMSVHLLGQIFDAFYESLFREEHNNSKTIMDAYYDALEGVKGKAREGIIRKNDANDNKLIKLLQNKKSYYIIEDTFSDDADYLRCFLQKNNMTIKEASCRDEAEICFHLCDYIFNVKDYSLQEIYIDGERNCIVTSEDVQMVRNYEYAKTLFIYMNQEPFLRRMHFDA